MSLDAYAIRVKESTKADLEKYSQCRPTQGRVAHTKKCKELALVRRAALTHLDKVLKESPLKGRELRDRLVSIIINIGVEYSNEDLVLIDEICSGYADALFCLATFKTSAEEVALAKRSVAKPERQSTRDSGGVEAAR